MAKNAWKQLVRELSHCSNVGELSQNVTSVRGMTNAAVASEARRKQTIAPRDEQLLVWGYFRLGHDKRDSSVVIVMDVPEVHMRQ